MYDAETGLQYSRARYYDPAARRFISEDPLRFAAGDTNLYRYVGNSPANGTDPSGTFVVGIGAILVLAGANLLDFATYKYDQSTELLSRPGFNGSNIHEAA